MIILLTVSTNLVYAQTNDEVQAINVSCDFRCNYFLCRAAILSRPIRSSVILANNIKMVSALSSGFDTLAAA